jgi:polyhydroxybutyrate depolymerase
MKRILFAILALTLSLLACARSGSTPQLSSSDSVRTITVDQLERTYIVHIPPAYVNSQAALPVVLSFHGGGGNAENAMRVSNFNSLADQKGFIVVYPNGNGRLKDKLLTWNGGACCGYAATNNIDDVGFVRALIKDLQTVANIDMKRIYATGLSNGGIFSYRLACDASDLIAAIAPVSGTLNYSRCQPKEPVSVIHFHGTDDENVPYNGGSGSKSIAGVQFASVKDSIDFWVNFDRCPSPPQTNSFKDIQHDTYINCSNGTSVELYTITGGKHAWPGSAGPAGPAGDEPTQSISATALIWEFFAAHPKQ